MHSPRSRFGRLAALLTIAAALIPRPIVASDFAERRNRMVDEEIVRAGVKDPRVIQSMRDTPRHEFVLASSRADAYYDMAIAIGQGQTISPPFVVAYMTEQLAPKPTDRVLEIGTGSGYQAAVLSPLVKDVYTIEIKKPLGDHAARTLKRLKYANVHAKVGDGYQGWPEFAPFDKIIVTCSPDHVPPKLVEQLREGGRLIVPQGERYRQTLYLFEKQDGKLKKTALLPTLFVPMTGAAEAKRQVKPDGTHPTIDNDGTFEQLETASEQDKENKAGPETNAIPKGWYYLRQMQLVEGKEAPEGSHYIAFNNSEPSRGSQALHGLSVDGRKVNELSVSVWVKAKDVRPGPLDVQVPSVWITFYDENRDTAGYGWVGPWTDSFEWQKVVDKVRVPPKAREAIVRIGLFGATGEIAFDDLRIEAAK